MGRKLVTICFWQNNDFLREFFNRPKLVPAAGRGVKSLQILLSFPLKSVPWCFEKVSTRTSIFSEHPFSILKEANVRFSFYCHANRSKSSMRRPLSNCRSLARWVWSVASFKSKIMTGGRFLVIGGRFSVTVEVLSGHQPTCFIIPTPNAARPNAPVPTVMSHVWCLCVAGASGSLPDFKSTVGSCFGDTQREWTEICQNCLFIDMFWCSWNFFCEYRQNTSLGTCIPILGSIGAHIGEKSMFSCNSAIFTVFTVFGQNRLSSKNRPENHLQNRRSCHDWY